MNPTSALSCFRSLAALAASFLLLVQPVIAVPPQQSPVKLQIVILEGEGAINNIRQRSAREPIVRVVDENNRPVAGATVYFLLPESGPGGTFANQARSLMVTTGKNGRAVAKGLLHNGQAGKFQISVEASYQDVTSSTTINQSNSVTSASAGASGKVIAILAIVAGAIAGGLILRPDDDDTGPTPTTVTPGAPSVRGN